MAEVMRMVVRDPGEDARTGDRVADRRSRQRQRSRLLLPLAELRGLEKCATSVVVRER